MIELQQAFQAVNAQHEKPPWANDPTPPPDDLCKITQRSIDIYMLSKQSNGEMGGIGWWQSANGYTAIALHDTYSKKQHNYETLASILKQCEKGHHNFINEFNDDSLWWGICCLHVYGVNNDAWYLDKARAVWRHILNSNSVVRRGQINFNGMDMEGACFWTTRPDEEQINSISTGLFAELSIRLALLNHQSSSSGHSLEGDSQGKHPSEEEYIAYARNSLGWILRCRYRAEEAVVLDNILVKKQIAQDWIFTYNTGVAMAVCALMFEATQEAEYLSVACAMAHKAMRRDSWVESNGVLTESGPYGKGNHEPWENSDAVGFKAVLIRQLGTLYRVIVRSRIGNAYIRECADLIKIFINVNIKSQQERNTNGNGQYGPWWNGPFEMPTSHAQMAVLDVMAAAVLVN